MKIIVRINDLIDAHESKGVIFSENHGECELCKEITLLGKYLEVGINTMDEVKTDISLDFDKNKVEFIKRSNVKKDITKEQYLTLPRYMKETDKAIALNCSIATLHKYKARWGIKDKRRTVDVTYDDYIKLPENMSLRKKAAKLGISYSTINELRKEWGIQGGKFDKITLDDYLKLPKHLSRREKARRLGMSSYALKTREIKWGLIKK